MKEILIISGKGGTGKTTVTASLADLAAQKYQLVMADADVDAANLEILVNPTVEKEYAFMAGNIAVIDQDSCTLCGRCAQVCHFDAVRETDDAPYYIDPAYCEGCLSCVHQCPVDAIKVHNHQSGEWYRSKSPYGPLFHANLYPGEENSGKLVTVIKESARAFGEDSCKDFLLIDGPPGIGCPVTAALNGVDIAVIVSEPTPTGFHDMRRVKAAADFFHIPTLLVINKHDLNLKMEDTMRKYAGEKNIPVIGVIPYDEHIVHAQSLYQPITQTLHARYQPIFQQLWEQIRLHIGM